MAGGSLDYKIKKAFGRIIQLGLVEPKPVKFFGAQATGCSPISTAVKLGSAEIEPQKPVTIARSLAIGNPADGHYAIKTITGSGGWSEDVSDPEMVIPFSCWLRPKAFLPRPPGGVTLGCVQKEAYSQDRIHPDETTYSVITGNGLKTTDVLSGEYEAAQPIPAKLAEFKRLRCLILTAEHVGD